MNNLSTASQTAPSSTGGRKTSFGSNPKKTTSKRPSEGLLKKSAITSSSSSLVALERTVRNLRLSKALTIPEGTSVYDACRRMASRRVAAVLLTDPQAHLSGIMTDKDVAARVIAEGLNPGETPISKVMTRNPHYVSIDSAAVEALEKMIEGKFRHLPVVDKGEVVALLDITKCLYDAISRLEKAAAKGSAIVAAVEGVDRQFGDASHTFIETLQERMFRPSLATVVSDSATVVTVSPDESVLAAAKKMREQHTNSVVVMSGVKLMGILTSKDILSRVVAKKLSADLTTVEKVMTQNPEYATTDTKILQALHMMHDGKFLHLPVVNREGLIFACVDVLQLTHAAMALVGNADGIGNDTGNSMMQKFWDSTLALDHTEIEDDSRSDLSPGMGSDATGYPSVGIGNMYTFKMWDVNGRVHRFNCGTESLSDLSLAVVQRLGNIDQNFVPEIMYEDDEGDQVLLLTDDDLSAAVNQARIGGWKAIKLHIYNSQSREQKDMQKEIQKESQKESRHKEAASLELMEREHKSRFYPAVISGAALLAGMGMLLYMKRSSNC